MAEPIKFTQEELDPLPDFDFELEPLPDLEEEQLYLLNLLSQLIPELTGDEELELWLDLDFDFELECDECELEPPFLVQEMSITSTVQSVEAEHPFASVVSNVYVAVVSGQTITEAVDSEVVQSQLQPGVPPAADPFIVAQAYSIPTPS